jgi:hypothetical protein
MEAIMVMITRTIHTHSPITLVEGRRCNLRRNYSKETFFKALFGIKEKVENLSKQLKEERKNLFDQSHKLTTFREAQEFMWHEGKTLQAFPYLLPESRCFVFPTTPQDCISLKTNKNIDIAKYVVSHDIKACLVVITFTAFSAEMAKSWIQPFYTIFRKWMLEESPTVMPKTDNSNLDDLKTSTITRTSVPIAKKHSQTVKLFDASMVSGAYLNFFKKSIIHNMKKNTPEDMLDHTVACFPMESQENVLNYFRARLDITNTKNCYVFLLDSDARVRWRAVGDATEEELQVLKDLTVQLLRSSG